MMHTSNGELYEKTTVTRVFQYLQFYFDSQPQNQRTKNQLPSRLEVQLANFLVPARQMVSMQVLVCFILNHNFSMKLFKPNANI